MAVFFFIIGVGGLAGGITLFIYTHSFVATAISASGVVVDLEPSSASRGRSGFYSVFTFADKNGQAHKCRTTFASDPAPFQDRKRGFSSLPARRSRNGETKIISHALAYAHDFVLFWVWLYSCL